MSFEPQTNYSSTHESVAGQPRTLHCRALTPSSSCIRPYGRDGVAVCPYRLPCAPFLLTVAALCEHGPATSTYSRRTLLTSSATRFSFRFQYSSITDTANRQWRRESQILETTPRTKWPKHTTSSARIYTSVLAAPSFLAAKTSGIPSSRVSLGGVVCTIKVTEEEQTRELRKCLWVG